MPAPPPESEPAIVSAVRTRSIMPRLYRHACSYWPAAYTSLSRSHAQARARQDRDRPAVGVERLRPADRSRHRRLRQHDHVHPAARSRSAACTSASCRAPSPARSAWNAPSARLVVTSTVRPGPRGRPLDQVSRRPERRRQRRRHADPRPKLHRPLGHRLVDPQDRHAKLVAQPVRGRPDRRAGQHDHVGAVAAGRLGALAEALADLVGQRPGRDRVAEQALVHHVLGGQARRDLLHQVAEHLDVALDRVDQHHFRHRRSPSESSASGVGDGLTQLRQDCSRPLLPTARRRSWVTRSIPVPSPQEGYRAMESGFDLLVERGFVYQSSNDQALRAALHPPDDPLLRLRPDRLQPARRQPRPDHDAGPSPAGRPPPDRAGRRRHHHGRRPDRQDRDAARC